MGRPLPEFHGFIGQSSIVKPLRQQIAGAMNLLTQSRHCPRRMFNGPSGIGKSHLARAAAKEYGTKLFRGSRL